MAYIDQKVVQVNDSSNALINPAQDETIILLRRLLQLSQSLSVIDGQQRQRIVVEGTTGTVNTSTVLSATGYNGVDPRQTFQDMGRNLFAAAIRPNLIFS